MSGAPGGICRSAQAVNVLKNRRLHIFPIGKALQVCIFQKNAEVSVLVQRTSVRLQQNAKTEAGGICRRHECKSLQPILCQCSQMQY